MRSNLLPYPIKDKVVAFQMAMHPIEIWECVFPKACLPNVLKGLKWSGEIRPELRWPSVAMRKVMALKKIPEVHKDKGWKDVKPISASLDLFSAYPIGIREDNGIWPKGTVTDGYELEGAEQL